MLCSKAIIQTEMIDMNFADFENALGSMHFQLGQQCFQDQGETRTDFGLPTLATITAFRRSNLLRFQVIAIRSQASLPALCHAIFSHCCGSCSAKKTFEEFY